MQKRRDPVWPDVYLECHVDAGRHTVAYRIHFTTEDLARTKVAQAPLPLMELDLAARALQVR